MYCVVAEEGEPEVATIVEDSREAQARHYKTLQELWKRPKPNQKDVSQLLELEFDVRRAFMDSKDTLSEEDWPAKILGAYPCFKELKHISGLKCLHYTTGVTSNRLR